MGRWSLPQKSSTPGASTRLASRNLGVARSLRRVVTPLKYFVRLDLCTVVRTPLPPPLPDRDLGEPRRSDGALTPGAAATCSFARGRAESHSPGAQVFLHQRRSRFLGMLRTGELGMIDAFHISRQPAGGGRGGPWQGCRPLPEAGLAGGRASLDGDVPGVRRHAGISGGRSGLPYLRDHRGEDGHRPVPVRLGLASGAAGRVAASPALAVTNDGSQRWTLS